MAAIAAGCLMGAGSAAAQDAAKDTPKDAAKDAAKDTSTGASTDAAKQDAAAAEAAKASGKGVNWFSRGNPFAPLTPTEKPKEPEPDIPEPDPDEVGPKTIVPAGPPAVVKAAEPAPVMPKLNGVLFSDRLTVAIVDDALVQAGDAVGSYRIVSIDRDTVLAEKEGQRYVMTTRQPAARLVLAAAAAPRPASAEAAPPSPAVVQAPPPQTQLSGPPDSADKPRTGPANEKAAGAPAPPGPATEGKDKP
jgi:hypothetical protein